MIVQSDCVIFDKGIYKMWYTANNDLSGHCTIGYATSTDGISWTKEGEVFAPVAGTWFSARAARPVSCLMRVATACSLVARMMPASNG